MDVSSRPPFIIEENIQIFNFSGVILATNKYGFRLEPVSWNEMRCPKTGVKEPRKTAKVLPQYIESSKE